MKRYDKLKQNWEFRRLYSKGKCLVSPAFILYYGKGKANRVRLGITAGKKFGTAVARNRAKRLVTAAFDAVLPQIKKGYNFVFVVRGRILSLKSPQVADMILNLLKQNDLIEK